MKRKGMMLLLSIAVLAMAVSGWASAQETGDGIPDNCEYTSAAYYQANVFPRYEPSASRVVLVDWTTGADVRELETGLVTGNFQLRGWSADCHYLAGAIMNAAGTYDTVVWDAVNGGRVGTVPDGRGVPHPIRWDTAGVYLLVETRNGAILLNLPNHSSVPLTSDADGYIHSFSSVQWDYAAGQLIATLAVQPIGATAVYDIASGRLLSLTSTSGQAIDLSSASAFDAQTHGDTLYACNTSTYSGSRPDNMRVIYQEYNHRVILMDAGTRDVVQVIDSNIETWRFNSVVWALGCRYLSAYVAGMGRVIWDVPNATRLGVFAEGHRVVAWEATGTYAIVSNRFEALLWHIPTDTRMPLRYGGIGTSFNSVVWDLGSGLVTTQISLADLTWQSVFDLNSGVEVSRGAVTVVGGAGRPPASSNLVEIGGRTFACHSNNPSAFYHRRSSGYGVRHAIVIYETSNHRLVIQDNGTREVLVEIETSFEPASYTFLGWAPGCRYIAAVVGTATGMDTVIWDMVNLRRVGVFADAQGHNHRLTWSPDGERVLVETRNGAYLWHLPTDTRTLIYDQVNADGYNFRQIGWDLARGQILAVTVGQLNAVTVYDIASGQQIAVYDVADRAAPVSYWILQDSSTIVVFTPEGVRLRDGRAAGLSVWNRDTHAGIQLTPREDLAVYSRSNILLSPDHRYLMILGYYGGVDVWDLQALTADGTPNARYHMINLYRLRFVDATTLETYSISATRYQVARRLYTRTTYRYDIRTGELISETSEELSYRRGSYVYPG